MTYAAYKCDLRRMQPSVWETAQMDPSQPTLSQNSQRATDDGTFIQTK